ncbi:unnamed protein product, partial [Meganyctiphanes norvegica]
MATNHLYTDGIQHIPKPRGEWDVGIIDICTDGDTPVLFRLFYPTELEHGHQNPHEWYPWYLGRKYSEGAASFLLPSAPWLITWFGDWMSKGVKVPAKWAAPPAHGSHPVIVVSHGMAGHRSFMSTLSCDLASHGFIVAAIEHGEGSAAATFRYEESQIKWVPYTAYKKGQLEKRVDEVASTVEALQKINSGKFSDCHSTSIDFCMFQGHLDLSRKMILGHSYGGATALSILSSDNNPFMTGVVLDPWMYPLKEVIHSVANNIVVNVLSISSQGFNQGPNKKTLAKLEHSAAVPNTRYLTIKNTIHDHGIDSPWISDSFTWWIMGGNYKVPLDTIYKLQNNIIIIFICKQLGVSISKTNEYQDFIKENEHLLIEGNDFSL